jgi:hypothetical protein
MDLTYAHCPKPFGGDVDLTLDDTAITAMRGDKKARFPLASIERIDLRFSPTSLAHHSFTCKIFAGRQTLRFSNISWRSLTDIVRQDEPYRDFVRALVERAGRANPNIVKRSGVPPFIFWITAPCSFAILLALVLALIHTLRLGSWPIALLIAGMIAYFAYWLRDYLVRNRPRAFTGSAIPPEILP